MTNKDKIQAAHLEAIKKTTYTTGLCNIHGEDAGSDSCTTITAEAIVEVLEWLDKNKFYSYKGLWFNKPNHGISKDAVKELFLNQPPKH